MSCCCATTPWPFRPTIKVSPDLAEEEQGSEVQDGELTSCKWVVCMCVYMWESERGTDWIHLPIIHVQLETLFKYLVAFLQSSFHLCRNQDDDLMHMVIVSCPLVHIFYFVSLSHSLLHLLINSVAFICFSNWCGIHSYPGLLLASDWHLFQHFKLILIFSVLKSSVIFCNLHFNHILKIETGSLSWDYTETN